MGSNLTAYFALSATVHLDKLINYPTKLKRENKIIIKQNDANNKFIENQKEEIYELKNIIKIKTRKEQMLKKCLSIQKTQNSMKNFQLKMLLENRYESKHENEILKKNIEDTS